MHPFQVLHLLILISLTTASSLEPYYGSKLECPSYCGKVFIYYPFGIGAYCAANVWFSVDCNSSTPYLSALNNVKMLSLRESSVTVNMPVIRADCKNPVQDIHLGLISSSHGKSPFLFSGLYNILVVEGCGSGVIMDKNGTVVSGCSSTCTDDNTVSDINHCLGRGCCQTTIPRDFKSFVFNLTGLERKEYGKENCGSAFLVATYSSQAISLPLDDHHTFVPMALSWNSTVCSDRCGEVKIPYPFGIGRLCSKDIGYNVDCNASTPYLSAFNNVQVLGINLERETVTVNVSKFSDCHNPVQSNYNLFLGESPFYVSSFDNIFVVEGCGYAAIMKNTTKDSTIFTGCSTTCHNNTVRDVDTNKCFGMGCCQTKIPYDLGSSFTLDLTGLQGKDGNVTCGSAFLVNWTSFIEGRFSRQFVPITLSWKAVYADDSAACRSCEEDGGSCHVDSSGTRCHFYGSNKTSLILGVSISMGVLFLTVITYALYKIIKKTKVRRRKQRCFKRNGGLLLKQQESTCICLVDKTILFTSKELKKATDHFNENRILGRGGQGTVYKGMLTDGRIVAIKKSKVVDESQLEQFINEVVILSQVNHRNVVRLLGCCLETEVPLLVSEYISNGTLYDLLHDENGEFPISLNLRLQIATEVARAVSYLHSATSIPIYHRDIKTTNILLDEKYRAKVSDFGTSRFVTVDQTHLTTLVKGTFGYLDPEYFQSSQFTEKSDVYSFGVVLLELLTREKPISLTRFGENRSLATHFLLAMEEGRVMSIFDAVVVKEGSRTVLLAVANLAMRCLNFNGRNRPTMKEVATELEGIRLSHVPFTVENSFAHVKQCEEVQLTYGESTSTSMTFDYNPSQ